MPTEAILQDINAVIGVTGSFVCLNDSSIAAQAMPASFDTPTITLVARIVSQTFQALETSGQRINEADLTFERARVVLKNLRAGVLVILCARTINLSLLNLTTSVAVRNLSEELKQVQAPATPPIITPTAAPEPAPIVAETPAASAPPNPLFAELESEWQQIMRAVASAKTILREMGALAIWLRCPQARALLLAPEKKHLEFAGHASQRDAIRRAFESVGYQTNLAPDEFRSAPRLAFTNLARGVTVEICLNTFAMYHQLDLTPYLTPEDAPLAETALLLLRLQLVEMSETGLRELGALLREHEISARAEPGKIDLMQITRLCADQWGWYKTVTMNLQRILPFAVKSVPSGDNTIVVERAARIRQAIGDAPKSLRWQTRARLGENVRWYDVPATATPEQPDVEIRSID